MAVPAAPSFQFGTGSMLASGGDRADGGGISFGTKAPVMPGVSAAGAKAYPRPEFAFGTGGAANADAPSLLGAASRAAPGAGFVPPVPSGPPPVPAGRPPEANQRGVPPTAHAAPGFGFTQPGFGLAARAAATVPAAVKTAPPTNAWGGAVAAAPASAADVNGSLGSEWDMSMGMGLDIGSSNSGMGTYDALGGPSPFGGFGGLGSLFSQTANANVAAAPPLDDGANIAAAPPGMWGAGGYGF